MINTAVIMAAGMGTRFGNRTSRMPKGFIEFKGIPMIERSIRNLIKAGIEKIIIGTGYHNEYYENIANKYSQILTVLSPEYSVSNSMETLFVCRNHIGDDNFLLLESDIIYESKALTTLIADQHQNIMLVSDVTKFQDQYYIGVNDDFTLRFCSTDKAELEAVCKNGVYGELVGIHKISNSFYKKMVADYERNRLIKKRVGYEYEIENVATMYTEDIINHNKRIDSFSVNEGKTLETSVYVLKLTPLQWYEIDDEKDLEYAETHIGIN